MDVAAGLHDTRNGIPDHGAHLRHEIVSLFKVEGIPGCVVLSHLLPAVVDGGRIPTL